MVSHLTSTRAELLVGILNELTGETASHLTMSEAEIRARILSDLTGSTVSHLTTGQDAICTETLTEFDADGISFSALALGREETLASILNELAAQEGGGGEEWLPEGATLYADFMEAHYYAGGEEVTVDEFLDDNDPSGITSDGTQANAGVHAPKLSAAARGSIAANDCCIVIEFRTPATLNNSRTLLTINNFEPDGDDADDSDKIEVSVEDTTSLYASHFNGDYDNIGGLSVDTTYRLALNFSGSGDIKASLNGGAIVTTSGPALAEWDIVQVGFQESAPIANPTNASLAFQGHIRKLEGYAQQDDAGLMSKSTVA